MQVKDIPDIEILKAHKEYHNILKQGNYSDTPFPCEVLHQYNIKLIQRKTEKLVAQGYLDFGVSLRSAWLTKKGEEYLEQLIKKGQS